MKRHEYRGDIGGGAHNCLADVSASVPILSPCMGKLRCRYAADPGLPRPYSMRLRPHGRDMLDARSDSDSETSWIVLNRSTVGLQALFDCGQHL